jgi:apolipoprotein N-acyltransferase
MVAGLAFFGVLLSWSVYFGVVALAALVVAQAAYWAGAGAAVAWLGRRGVSGPLITAAVWVLAEAVRTRWPLGGLAWGQLGVALHDLPAARRLAAWGGVPLLSCLVVAAAAALARGLDASRRGGVTTVRDPVPRAAARRRAVLAGAAVLAVGAALAPATTTPSGALRVAVLQGNDQNRRLTPAEIDAGALTRRHLELAERLRGRYDLIVFPESALESDPETDPALRARIVALARRHRSAVLVNVIERTGDRRYNANRLYRPDGSLAGTYRKRHLVPFGEYVPWRRHLGFIRALEQVPEDFDPGRADRLFGVGGRPVATVICFESAFGPQVRGVARAGAEAVVVSTNNRSYRRSANSAQHVALSQMRAAETGRPVVHAAVSGISAVIDAGGHVTTTTRLFERRVVEARITAARGRTPYMLLGDWVEWAAALGIVASVGLTRRRRRTLPDRP